MEKLVSTDQLESVLREAGLDSRRIEGIIAALSRQAADSCEPQMHSAMSFHEAQDWLAANDREGSDYWRSQPLTKDLIAAVGDLLEASGDTSKLKFDAAWQGQYCVEAVK